MAEFDEAFWQETRQLAEVFLSQKWGGPVRLHSEPGDLGGSDRSLVYRFEVTDGPSSAPPAVIAKRANPKIRSGYRSDVADTPAWTLFNEWASLQFLSEIFTDEPVCPRFYGGDRTGGLILMEDLGQTARLDHFLLGNDPAAARTALLDYSRLHGRLHAGTAGQSDRFEQIRRALGPMDLPDENLDWLKTSLETLLAFPGLSLSPATQTQATAEVDRLVALLTDYTGPFKTFTQTDCCPDNLLQTSTGWRLIDFEGSGYYFSFCLLDGVYPRMRFPTCWCVDDLPPAILAEAETAYRAELVKGIPAASDDKLFYEAVCQACAVWILEWTRSFPLEKQLEEDKIWRQSSARQRTLTRCEVVRQTTARYGHLTALGEIYGQLGDYLRDQWQETAPMPLYPAFV